MPPKRAAPQETQAETQAVVKRYRQVIDEPNAWRTPRQFPRAPFAARTCAPLLLAGM